MKRIIQISLVLVALALSFASCATTDDIDPNTNAADPNACLTLNTATVEGLLTRAATTRGDAPRVATDAFENGDVIQIQYDFTGNFSTPQSSTAYARLEAGGWAIYSDLDLNTPAKLRPNPDNTGESWANLRLLLNFHPLGIVTDADGKKKYENNTATPDASTGIWTFYDYLRADGNPVTSGTPAAGQYSVSSNGQVTANFRHLQALLSLPQSAITVNGYPEETTLTALGGTIVGTNADGVQGEPIPIVFTLKPATTAGTQADAGAGATATEGTWQAIVPATIEAAGVNYTLKTLTATIAHLGVVVTAPVTPATAAVAFRRGTRYGLTLTLNPGGSTTTITEGVNGWGDEEGMETLDEGVHYTLATEGNKATDWTILTGRGLGLYRDYVNSLNVNAKQPNATLATNIDLKGNATNFWTPIGIGGTTASKNKPYTARFDGGGHTVRGLYIYDGTVSYEPYPANRIQGLFGVIIGGTVQHLSVEGSIYIWASQNVDDLYIYLGGIAGISSDAELTDCHSAVKVTACGLNAVADKRCYIYAGGICGRATASAARNPIVSNCTSTSEVTTTTGYVAFAPSIYAGGICGELYNGSLVGCSHNGGSVSFKADNPASTGSEYIHVGGIAGNIYTDRSIPLYLMGCTNTAPVSVTLTSANTSGMLYIGGVVGGSTYAPVVACSNSGAITYSTKGYLYAGGVVGRIAGTTTVALVNTGDLSGTPTSNVGGLLGSNSNTTDQNSYSFTCFYKGSERGANGIGGGTTNTNTDGGRVADNTELNSKVDAMNASIEKFNAGTLHTSIAVPATLCPYRWEASTDGTAPKLILVP